MELFVIPKGSGKYTVTDKKDRKIYSVTKAKKKLFGGNPITTLHDASGYALYTQQRTAAGKKPAFRVDFNDEPFMTLACKSVYLDPSLICEGQGMKWEIKSKDRMNFEIFKDGKKVGKMETQRQTNNEAKFYIEIDDKVFDDYIPLFAVCADKSFSQMNKAE